ncbi:MAG TPA: lysophospholipid acyltransferase family protein [Rickettsiales bacterium]|nr:lysophospholipid acyltransferase family protein [Rickettsiales bacterium]
MKKPLKRLFKTAAFHTFVCWLIACYIRLVYYSSRRRMTIDPAAQIYMNGELPAIFAFWHGRLLLMPMICPPGRKMNVMISTHGDGEVIARAMHNFGFETVRGSSRRGGSSAALNAVKALQAGENVSITPDGPRGPAMKVQQGSTSISGMAQVPVIPVTYSASRNKRMRSWDSFMLALPFGRICYKIGAPLFDASPEALEKDMVRLTEEVDQEV